MEALTQTMQRAGVASCHVESPFATARGAELRKAGRAPQTEEQRTVTLVVDLGPLWRGHAEAQQIRITAKRRDTAVENLDALQRAFETIRLTAVRDLDGIVFRLYAQMFPPAAPQQQQTPPPQQQHVNSSRGAYAMLHIADNAPLAVAEAAYRALVKDAHPDVGGAHERMLVLNAAIATIRLQQKASA